MNERRAGKTRTLTISMSAETRAAIQVQAERSGMSLSAVCEAWIRDGWRIEQFFRALDLRREQDR